MENRKISKIEIYNMWGEYKNITIDFPKNVTFITGFNGTGKSTILDIINTSSQEKHSSSLKYKDWVSKIVLGLDVSFFFTSINQELNLNREKMLSLVSDKMKHSDTSAKDLGLLLGKSEFIEKNKKNKKVNKQKNIILNNKDSNSSDIFMTEASNEKKKSYKYVRFSQVHADSQLKNITITSMLKPVFYRDDIFVIPDRSYINAGNRLEESIFDRDSNLNLTLTELILEFLSIEKKINEKSTKSRMNSIEEVISKMFPENKSNVDKLKIAELKKQLNSIINEDISIEEKHRELLEEEINYYFSCTDKKLIRDERGIIEFEHNDKKIPCGLLSKGEKQLLTLLLLAFIYSNETRVFILDEPDLSLHVEWQKNIIKSMVKLSPNSQFIIATHSPILFMNEIDYSVINTSDL